MASTKLVLAMMFCVIAYASGQAIVDNLYPKAGDICRDRGTSWANIKLGKCENGTVCQAYKRGVFKCVPLDPKLGQMPINTVCYNETKVNQKDTKVGEQWRKYYRQRNCVWKGLDVQGTPKVQCVQTQEKGGIYRCKEVAPLFKKACYVVSGSMVWGKYNDNQAYDACNGCPCTLPGKKGKYPLCRCQDTCDAARQKTQCATD